MDEASKKQLQEMLDKQTEALNKRMLGIENTLKPIAEIYDQAQGFNSVLGFIFKKIIVPLSILIGILLSLREVFGYHK